MTDDEKIEKYKEYMIEKKYDTKTIEYNLLVIKLLVNNVLYFFEETLENIDTYTFEEFTDKINIIDKYLGGRDGIPKMLNAMMDLTEFLKVNKLIKGGKIAHYKRMFSDVDYCLNKYDTMTGKKDDGREFIKSITTGNRISSDIIKSLEDFNVYGCKTLDTADKFLNDVPVDESEYSQIIKNILVKLKLFEKRNDGIETTKKGRMFSRLTVDERYGALMFMLCRYLDWQDVIEEFYKKKIDIDLRNTLNMIVSMFYKTKELKINYDYIKEIDSENSIIESSTDEFRMAKIENIHENKLIFNICFINMGLIEVSKCGKNSTTYNVTDLGQRIFNILYYDVAWDIRNIIDTIGYEIKNKNYSNAEKEIIKYLNVYGGNTAVWDYFGQILLVQKKYKYAYKILKYGYEKSSKRGKASKAALYHLVLCCRKLKKLEETNNYESKLNSISKVKMN